MSLLYALTGEWIFLLNPALWILDLHPAIVFLLAIKYKCRCPVIFTCLLTVILSGIFVVPYILCHDMFLDFLINNVSRSYTVHNTDNGIRLIIATFFGWTYSIFLIPFWFLVLFLPWLICRKMKPPNIMKPKVLTSESSKTPLTLDH